MKRILLCASLALLVTAVACTEDETPVDPNAGRVEAESFTSLSAESALVLDVAEGEAATPGFAKATTRRNCIDRANSSRTTVMVNGVAMRRVVITFTGDTCAGGNTRSGQIIIQWTANADSLTATRTVFTRDYRVNNLPLSHFSTINFALATRTWTITTRDTVTNGAGERAWLHQTTTRVWTEGFMTPTELSDDRVSVTFAARGKDFTSPEYAAATNPGLLWSRGCDIPQYVSGTVRIQAVGGPPVRVEYGDGACDNIATMFVGEFSREIDLPRL